LEEEVRAAETRADASKQRVLALERQVQDARVRGDEVGARQAEQALKAAREDLNQQEKAADGAREQQRALRSGDVAAIVDIAKRERQRAQDLERRVNAAPRVAAHTVRPGETLAQIAQQYGVSPDVIRAANASQGHVLPASNDAPLPSSISNLAVPHYPVQPLPAPLPYPRA
jgi:hypothetical protein